MTDLQAAIVTEYHAGRFSYAEALRRLLDGHVPASEATRWLAAPAAAAPRDSPGGRVSTQPGGEPK